MSCLALLKRQYNPDFRSIYDLVNDWLTAAIKNCRKRQKDTDPNQTTLAPSAEVQAKKIQTTLSVAEIACMLKMFTAAGIITNEMHIEVFDAVSKTFKAKKTESIAIGSLNNKFYNIEDKTWESIHNLMRLMLRLQR